MSDKARNVNQPERAPDPTASTMHWDARWNSEQRRIAVEYAQDLLRKQIEALRLASAEVDRAADWVSSVSYFKAAADAREVGVEVDDNAR